MSIEYNMWGVPEKNKIIGKGVRNVICDEDVKPTPPPNKACPNIRKEFDIHPSGKNKNID